MRGKPLTKQVAVSNLEIGKAYRDYRALCEILNENTRTGSSKNAQLKNWARYFLYEKEGREYIIREIYSEPLPIKRKTKNNSSLNSSLNLNKSVKMESSSTINEKKDKDKNKDKKVSVLNPEVIKHMLIQQEISLFTNQYNVAKNQMTMAKEQIQGLKGRLKQVRGYYTGLKEKSKGNSKGNSKGSSRKKM